MTDKIEARGPAFMGLWEAIAWGGLRDEVFSSRVRSDVAEWFARELQQKLHPLDIFDGLGMPIGDAFECLADLCRTGELGAKGKAHDGFRDITSNEWHELSLVGADSPDGLKGAPFLAGMGEDDTGWTSVRFKRSDIERLFPPDLPAPTASDEEEGPPFSGVHIQATAGGILDCTQWLRQEFADPGTAVRTRGEFKVMALSRYPNRLSGRGFDRAWRDAQGSDLSRGKPGPKPKTR